MKFGINTFLFSSPFTNEGIDLFSRFKEWGFDLVEIALEDPSDIDPAVIKEALRENGLACNSICAVMSPGRDLRGTKQQQDAALHYIKSVLDLMPELGCEVLAGPLYSSVGRAGFVSKADYSAQWNTVAGHLKALSEYAAQQDLTLAIEPLNRYETDFINTCGQALQMIHEVNSPALRLHLDAYHMNIEEKYPADSILNAGNKLAHFHACGCDRGVPGRDHIDWESMIKALGRINYKGNIVIESFTPDVKSIAKAASIWREIEPSPSEIAIKGRQFLASCFG